MKRAVKDVALALNGHRWRMRANGPNPPRFSGYFTNRADAIASQTGKSMVGYDNDAVTDVSFDAMCKVKPWDYPILFWLQKCQQNKMKVVDAGGHMGTKYIAFESLIDLSSINWTIYDLDAIVKAGKQRQADGKLPEQIIFESDLSACGVADILLASGLLQYLDVPLSQLVKQMQTPPQFIFLNKVAMRDGPAFFTLEQIGPSKVPYQIRCKSDFESEIAAMGYRVLDQWEIPELSHVIATHPLKGASESCGYILERVD